MQGGEKTPKEFGVNSWMAGRAYPVVELAREVCLVDVALRPTQELVTEKYLMARKLPDTSKTMRQGISCRCNRTPLRNRLQLSHGQTRERGSAGFARKRDADRIKSFLQADSQSSGCAPAKRHLPLTDSGYCSESVRLDYPGAARVHIERHCAYESDSGTATVAEGSLQVHLGRHKAFIALV